MSLRVVDAFTRGVAAQVTRRGSPLTLGAAAIGGAAPPIGSDARKKKGPDCQKKAKQRCRNDAASCKVLVQTACADDPTCIATASLCCEKCSANGLLTCLLATQASATAMARLT